MGFKIAIGKDQNVFPQLGDIAKRYFSVDTATPDTAYTWYRHNPWAVVTASIGTTIHGFADFLPLSSEAVKLMEDGDLIEEDITSDHILPPEAMRYCRSLYFSGIAIRDKGTFLGARCATALVIAAARLMEQVYGETALERIYTNPTTYAGNRLGRRMGFEPVRSRKTNMNRMDLYVLPYDSAHKKKLQDMYTRYHPHLIENIDFSLDQIPTL